MLSIGKTSAATPASQETCRRLCSLFLAAGVCRGEFYYFHRGFQLQMRLVAPNAGILRRWCDVVVMQAGTSAIENIIPFPTARIEGRAAVRGRALEAFFLGQGHYQYPSVEAAVMAWINALPPARCRGRAAWAMRVKLVESRSRAMQHPSDGAALSAASTSQRTLRQRQVLALLGAMSRHCWPGSNCPNDATEASTRRQEGERPGPAQQER